MSQLATREAKMLPNEATPVLLVDQDNARAEYIEKILIEHNYNVSLRLPSVSTLISSVSLHDPDLVILSVSTLTHDVLDSMAALKHAAPKPVVIFAEQDSPQVIDQVVKAGVSAYVVDTIQPKRIPPIINLAIARFKEFQGLRDELEETKHKLSTQKLLQRAKGLLMEKEGLTEDEAHHCLRKMAMDKGVTLAEVAQNTLDVFSMLNTKASSQ